MNNRPALTALTAFLLMAVVLRPLAALDRPVPSGVAYLVGAASGSDASLREVVAASIAVQLARRKAAVEELGNTDAPVLSRLLSTAAARNSQFLLMVSYTTTASEITLVLHLYDVAASKEVGGTAVTGRIDLSLDTIVAQAMERAARGIEFRPPAAGGTAQAAGAAASGAVVGQAPQTGAAGETGTTAAAGEVPAATGPAVLKPSALPPARPRRKGASLGVSSGAAAFLPTGPAGSYAAIGGLASLSLNLRFPWGPGTFGAGVLSGALAIHASGAVTEADILLVPIGVDASYTLNDGGFPGFTLHLSAGPAVMNVTTAYAGSLTKTIPYLLTGMILELPFAAFLGLSIEAQWAAFFESIDLPIMGFAPEVSFYVRF